MAIEIPLHKYQICTRENWNKASSNSDQKNNENNETDLNTDDKDI